jgi:hypothetical protein
VDDVTGDQRGTCGAHAGLGSDLRGTALVLLERLRAAVEPLRDGPAPEPGSAGACQACPVCAVVAVLRGERSELAAQLAEHATGLVTVLATVLAADEPARPPRADARPDPSPRPDPPSRPDAPPRAADAPRTGYAARVPSAHGRAVQRITVHRR